MSLLGPPAFAEAPVYRLRRALEARDAADLAPLDLPGVLAAVAAAADAPLGRLRRALDAERAFTGDAAHELRTPSRRARGWPSASWPGRPQGPWPTARGRSRRSSCASRASSWT